MSDADPPAPATPRDAASLLVVRGAGDAVEVLMGLRGAGHRFMPNRLVFPGGAVDPADATAPHATPLRPATRRLLERAAIPELAQALGMAAARELAEETGLHLGDPPSLAPLDYLCRAVTPPVSPIRFNARFLVVDAAHIRGELAGSGEIEDVRFYSVAEALALDLAWITRGVLDQLRVYLAMDPAARDARMGLPVCQSRNWTEE